MTNKGYWKTCTDCVHRLEGEDYEEYPCGLSHSDIHNATSRDPLTGDIVCNLKRIEMIKNDDRKIWKCECGFDNKAEDEYCHLCHEPQVNKDDLDESIISFIRDEAIEYHEKYLSKKIEEGISMKISEQVSQLSIEIEKMEKQISIRDFYNSLLNTVQEAGGSTSWINEDTTVKELADTLAPNGVRFIYEK